MGGLGPAPELAVWATVECELSDPAWRCVVQLRRALTAVVAAMVWGLAWVWCAV